MITRVWLTAAKLTCPRNMLRTSNSFARSDTGIVVDSEPHPSRYDNMDIFKVRVSVCFTLNTGPDEFNPNNHTSYALFNLVFTFAWSQLNHLFLKSKG